MNKEKLVLSIKSNGDTTGKNSAFYDIQLGDWKLKRGVRAIHLDMVASDKPRLVIECDPEHIEVEGLEVEALITGADPAKTDTNTTNKCAICLEKAELELENGAFICENCAQIMGELAED